MRGFACSRLRRASSLLISIDRSLCFSSGRVAIACLVAAARSGSAMLDGAAVSGINSVRPQQIAAIGRDHLLQRVFGARQRFLRE